MAKPKTKRKIRNAYDAYWFLYYHPKLNVMERTEVTPEEADKMEKEGYLITRDTGGKCYRLWRHLHRRALQDNLDIFYTKTNKPGGHGRVDKDKSKNKYVECWLEFGPLYYGYAYSGGKEPMAEWDNQTMLHHSHDIYLDTGGSTFDEGLVNLAKNVLKRYGDYSEKLAEDGSRRWCGKPVCGDCVAFEAERGHKRKPKVIE
jgi:hypothetical protein